MKLKLDFEDLEQQWKARQLDLFPWFDGLFALLRSKEAIIKETEKKLAVSSPATMIQFLSSDDRNNARVARETIKKQDPEYVLPILLYSLEKVKKIDYPHRVMESLLDFNPAVFFGYLLSYLNLHKKQKTIVFQVISEIFTDFRGLLSGSLDEERFLSQIFQAIREDLKERMPSSKKFETMEDLETVDLDLRVMLLIFNKTIQYDIARVVENEMEKIGRDIIISLHGLPFDFEKGHVLFKQLSEIIPYMALMRLKPDLAFLRNIPVKIEFSDISHQDREIIIQKAAAAVKVIEHPDWSVKEILDELDVSFFPLFF